MLASLYAVLYLISLVEITAFVNSRKDMHSIKAHWGDGFLVAVDNNDVVIGTIAYVEKDDIVWQGVPVSGKTIVLSTVLGEFSPSKV